MAAAGAADTLHAVLRVVPVFLLSIFAVMSVASGQEAPSPREAAEAGSSQEPQEPQEPQTASVIDDIHLDLLVGTEWPLHVGGWAWAELPYRIQAGLGLGWLPGAYIDAATELLEALGWMSRVGSNIISALLEDALVFRLSAGWRPFADEGFFFHGGYTFAGLGAGLSGLDVVNSVLPDDRQLDPAVDPERIPMSSNVHMGHVGVGWRFLFLEDRLVLRTSLDFAHAFAASSEILLTGETPAEQVRIDDVNVAFDSAMSTILTNTLTYLTVGVMVGYRFF